MLIEKILAGLIVLVCALMLLRLVLGARRQQRFDAFWRRAWYGLRGRSLRIWHWRSSRKHAERMAEQAIRRAREGVQRDGNVYKPKSFRGPRKPTDKPH